MILTNCRVCGSPQLRIAIDLGEQPWGNHFLTKEEIGYEPFYPLRVVYCIECCTAQLDYTVPKETMFSDHTYLSGITKTLDNHFEKVTIDVDELFFKNQKEKSVLDIGSNDGTQLKHFKKLGYDVLGVDPSKRVVDIANKAGINTICKFFNLETSKEIGRKFDIINAAGVFFHLEELHSVTDGIKESLKENGVFVVQFMYMKRILDNMSFDQIYHEHLLYYNLKTIQKLLSMHELEMFDAHMSPIHGGSVIAYVGHPGKRNKSDRMKELIRIEDESKCNEFATYDLFSKKIELMKKENIEYLNKAKNEGKKIFGLGAPVKGNTLLNYYGIGTEQLEVLTERNLLRRNLYSPGKHIPVVLEEEIDDYPDIYYVLAWNFKKEILERNKHLIDKGVEFYFPIDQKEIL